MKNKFFTAALRKAKRLLLLCPPLFVALNAWGTTTDWSSQSWLGNGGVNGKYTEKVKAVVTPALTSDPGINNLQPKNSHDAIHVAMPSSEFGEISLSSSQYTIEGAGFFPYLEAFTKQENEFTVVCGGTTYTFTVYYADGEPDDLTDFNIAKGKTSVAGKYPAGYEPYRANDGNIEDGDSRWASGSGAQHYATVGDAAEDWWYVDLGDFYRIDQVKILFETAAPTDYDLLVSNNALSWTLLKTYTEQPKVGNNAENYNVYDFSADPKVGRYVKIFARQGYSSLAYGISMYEFEVYGDHADVTDVNPPTMGEASLNGTPSYDRVNINVTGTDTEDGTVVSFHVVDALHSVDQVCAAQTGVITVTGLTAQTSYTFTITALDAVGNESANNASVEATTTQDTSVPLVAAPVPNGTGKEILPIYSDAFTSILEHEFDKDGFAGVALMEEKNIGGDNCLVYNIASANEVTWGHYVEGDNAIIAKEAYRGSGNGIDASAMEYLHIDIWSLQSATNAINININDAALSSLRLSHNGGGWQSYDIALSEFAFNNENAAYSSDNVRWMKFNGIGFITGKMALDNVYFWKTADGLHAVSATANNATYGTATVVVTETNEAPEGGTVTDGTEVTFKAIANDGYLFTGWSNGETSASFTTTITATTNLTANFRKLGTTYCNTLVHSNNGGQEHDAYVTVKRSAENTYQVVVRADYALGNFSNTEFRIKESAEAAESNYNLNSKGELSADKHTLTGTFTSYMEPWMISGQLYVNIEGQYEGQFGKLDNIEYAVECDDEVSVTGFTLSQNTAKLLTGKTLTLTPAFTPAYATNTALTWESSNTAVAKVDNGVVTAVAAGTATITAKLASDNSISATCTITVVDALAETVWHGYGIAHTPTEKNVVFTYSVTRDVEQHLTFSLTTDKNLAGFVADIYINGTEYALTGYGDALTASYTTSDTYEDNISLNCGWNVKGVNYGETFNFTYMVGSENEELKMLFIDEAKDNTSTLAACDGETVTIASVTRSFNAEELYTLVLPFDVDATQTAAQLPGQLTKLNNAIVKENGDLRLNFVNVEAIEAGVPYLYEPSSDVVNPTFSAVTVSKDLVPSTSDEHAKYYGIYAPTNTNDLSSITNSYVLGDERWLYKVSEIHDAGANYEMKALRAYFVLDFPTGANPAPRARIIFNSNETNTTTGVDETNILRNNDKRIENGQLIIIREGRKYNAQGKIIQ